MNKGKTKIWHLPFNSGVQVYRSQSWPCWDQPPKSLSKLCAVFASWTPLPLWSWVVLGPGRLLALAEWMWTCSAALFFCLKTWWLAGIAGAGLPHGAFLSTSVEFQFWHVNYSIMAAEFLMWIGSFFPPSSVCNTAPASHWQRRSKSPMVSETQSHSDVFNN